LVAAAAGLTGGRIPIHRQSNGMIGHEVTFGIENNMLGGSLLLMTKLTNPFPNRVSGILINSDLGIAWL
jgi:hypothetical protein